MIGICLPIAVSIGAHRFPCGRDKLHRADGAVIFGIPIDVAIIGIWSVRRIVQAIEGDAVDGWLGVAGVVKLGGLKPIAVVGAVAGLHVA